MDLPKHPQVILRRSSTCHTCRKAPVSPLHHFRRGEYIEGRGAQNITTCLWRKDEEGIYLCVGKRFLKLDCFCHGQLQIRFWKLLNFAGLRLPQTLVCETLAAASTPWFSNLRLARQFSMFARIPIAFKCSLEWAKKNVVPKMTIWILYR